MEQYIKKSTLVAEIERRKQKLLDHIICERDKEFACRTAHQFNRIIDFINTPEVKEVDLEKELDEWIKYGPHTNYPWCTIPDAIRITAEHFFELGLKSKGE